MRHVTIVEYGSFLGVTGNRLVVSDKQGQQWETPLSRLRSIRIAKAGVSLSGALIQACALRGIRLFFVDWRNVGVAALMGAHQHAVVEVRKAQFRTIESARARDIATQMILAKIRHQRAVLLYFGKYLSKKSLEKAELIKNAALKLQAISSEIKECLSRECIAWREQLMGYEGVAAKLYWQSLIELELLPTSFIHREGRGAIEITNSALNYGYAILSSYIWSALDNAGLEVYAGLLHVNRPGKASLVLDLMEEYRAWVVDRNIIKLRHQLQDTSELTRENKTAITNAIDETMTNKMVWHGKQLRLENILQRQAYRLAGAMVDSRPYKGIHFRW